MLITLKIGSFTLEILAFDRNFQDFYQHIYDFDRNASHFSGNIRDFERIDEISTKMFKTLTEIWDSDHNVYDMVYWNVFLFQHKYSRFWP